MPVTSSPNYKSRLSQPNWGPVKDPSSINSMGQSMVKSGLDEIRAEHINGIRLILDLIYDHNHEYSDNIGSC